MYFHDSLSVREDCGGLARFHRKPGSRSGGRLQEEAQRVASEFGEHGASLTIPSQIRMILKIDAFSVTPYATYYQSKLFQGHCSAFCKGGLHWQQGAPTS